MRIINKIKNIFAISKNTNEVVGELSAHTTAIIKNNYLRYDCTIGADSVVENCSFRGKIVIGINCKVNNVIMGGNVNVGNNTSLWGPNLSIIGGKQYPVNIGKFCSIAKNVVIQSYNHNHKKIATSFIGQNFFKEEWKNERIGKEDGINIKNDVWIGANAVVLSGVVLDNGCIVAAGAVVTKSVPPYAIVAGSPARIIGYRFSEDVINKLLAIQWWDWDNEKILKNKSLFEGEYHDETLLKFLDRND